MFRNSFKFKLRHDSIDKLHEYKAAYVMIGTRTELFIEQRTRYTHHRDSVRIVN